MLYLSLTIVCLVLPRGTMNHQDPYCIIHVDSCKAKTKVKRKSLVRFTSSPSSLFMNYSCTFFLTSHDHTTHAPSACWPTVRTPCGTKNSACTFTLLFVALHLGACVHSRLTLPSDSSSARLGSVVC
jgi:hypothetical protein